MGKESYPCYVIIRGVGADDCVELPTEDDGGMLLSTINSQFPSAIGLRFKAESGAWRGLQVNGGVLQPPPDGWSGKEFHVTTGMKRKADPITGPVEKKALEESDLIVLGLPYSTTEGGMEEYFQQFGELASCEVKLDPATETSKGFGFIRFKTREAVEACLAVAHTIEGRRCEVRFPKRDALSTPTKLFVGRLPKGTTVDEMTAHFSEYGSLTDVYIPTEFRGFGFVTFGSVAAAQQCLASTHVFKGCYLNVSHPQLKKKGGDKTNQSGNGYYSNGYPKTGKVA